LWGISNIDFYVNVKVGSTKRNISKKEVAEGLEVVEKVIEEIERILKE